jgi:hypothetical protein
MSEEHTPGPWSINPGANPTTGWHIEAKQGPLTVCPAKAYSEADAHLIAAAPELYEALEQLLDDMGEDGLCVCPAAKTQAIAALRKARGETP